MNPVVTNVCKKGLLAFALLALSSEYANGMERLPSDPRRLLFEAVIASSDDYDQAQQGIISLSMVNKNFRKTFNESIKGAFRAPDNMPLVRRIASDFKLRNFDEIFALRLQIWFCGSTDTDLHVWIRLKKYHSPHAITDEQVRQDGR